MAELERRHGSRWASWTYHDAQGEPVGVVVRWDSANDKKDIRPVSRFGDRWRIGGMPEPRPLYCLPDLDDADRVFITEGEKAADAARSIGLVAATSAHNGESAVIDRKTGTSRTIYVPQASVAVTGGIQPAILQRALGIEHWQSGLAARRLLSCPPRRPKRWSEAGIDPDAEAAIARVVDRLYELQPIDDDYQARPVVVQLTPEAKAAWKAYYNAHAEEQVDLAGELSAAR